MEKIIIDTDVGSDVDDFAALVLALNMPESLDLLGVTTVYGDVRLRARIALKLLKLMGRSDIPVAAGVGHPVDPKRDVWWFGHEGKGFLTDRDEALQPAHRHAVDFIIETVLSHPKEITLVTIGPLTNVALAIMKAPEIVDELKQIVMMGGIARIFDNTEALWPIEHNMKCDPQAAEIVFSSGTPITMVGLDVTMKLPIDRGDVETIRNASTVWAEPLAELIEIWLGFLKREIGWSGNEAYMHDPLAVAVAAQPDWIETVPCKVLVETRGEHTAGMTLVKPDSQGEVEVARSVRAKEFIDFFMDRMMHQKT